MSEKARRSREEDAGCCVMVFAETGNAFDSFAYTPEELEAQARKLRQLYGESTTVTYGPSPFVTGTGGVSL